MKKPIFLCIALILSLTGCTKTGWNGHKVISIPKEQRFVYFYSREFGTDTSGSARMIDSTSDREWMIDFYHPNYRMVNRLEMHPGWTPNGLEISENSPRYCYRVEILDVEWYTNDQKTRIPGRKWPQASYHAMVLTDESNGEEINRDAYLHDDYGSPQYIHYGYSRYAVGQEYLIADAYLPYLTEWRDFPEEYSYLAPYVFEIQEINGVEYLYPCRSDISMLEDKIAITDPLENQRYKNYKDWDIIEYLEENGLENPTFDYKIRLEDFVAWHSEYNADWNAAVLADGEPEIVDSELLYLPGILGDDYTKFILNPREK